MNDNDIYNGVYPGAANSVPFSRPRPRRGSGVPFSPADIGLALLDAAVLVLFILRFDEIVDFAAGLIYRAVPVLFLLLLILLGLLLGLRRRRRYRR